MLSKIENRNRNEMVYETIKSSIINDILKPGQKLNIEELSKQLGVSRTPISNAMKALEMDNYVVILPQNGTKVRELTEEELGIVYDMREIIEGMIVRIISFSEHKIKLEMYRSEFEKYMQLDQFSKDLICEFYGLELEFHDFLTSICPSIIQSETKNIIDLTKRSRKLNLEYELNHMNVVYIKEEDIKLHIRLIDAMLNDDIDLAEKLAKLDVRQTKVEVFRNLFNVSLGEDNHDSATKIFQKGEMLHINKRI